jgi:hypothetical protein
MTTPRKKQADKGHGDDVPFMQRKINFPVIGNITVQGAVIMLLFASTPMGQRMLESVGIMTQVSDVTSMKKDIADIKSKVNLLAVEISEIKSLAEIKKNALDSVAQE